MTYISQTLSLPFLLLLLLSLLLLPNRCHAIRKVSNLEWCEDAPSSSLSVNVKDTHVIVNEEDKEVTFSVDLSFSPPSSFSLSFPETFYRLSVWEEETGERDRIRKGDIWKDFTHSHIEEGEGEGGEGRVVKVNGSLTRPFASLNTNYEVTFAVFATEREEEGEGDGEKRGGGSAEEVVCFVVKFQVQMNAAASKGPTKFSTAEL